VINGGVVPVGLSYDSTAARLGLYRVEWSGPADNNTWDWMFYNGSAQSIKMEFVAYCQKGS
jgi:hypothetical protein